MTQLSEDARKYAPATQRNRDPILTVLKRVLPPTGTVLEIASGTGEHAVYFAPQLQPRGWQPTEPEAVLRRSIEAWQMARPCKSLYPPLAVDARASQWAIETDREWATGKPPLTAIVAINLLHISPWETTLGLLAGANRLLPPDGVLYIYGAFKRGGRHTAASNAAFDEILQQQNPSWGVRDLDEVVAIAEGACLDLDELVEMPANNFSVVFRKRPSIASPGTSR
ncbi:DUF938 domain-containing protein [Oxynema sp. CENA135]|uniref:DUF938 domain-containing protein n=1 Tax=Oxynema sp. CENA135 TaxID=984206 RepID=UPI00190980AE|nr:DUF938 domain-containing protein [Oxynema sp. CENA135]MBK4731163.1 DUF938 domain-containing protein [Oxynema sp. CENA135]